MRLSIADTDGNVVRSFSSEDDADFVAYEGYPSKAPTLDKKQGLNRFVWDMRHHSLEGIPAVYIEASFRGHKAIPGTYSATLSYGEHSETVEVQINKNPLLETTNAQYADYHEFMSAAEATYNQMTLQVNLLYNVQKKLETILEKHTLDEGAKQSASQLAADLKQFDSLMAQRLSKAYDDVENYVNGFTANYIRAFNEADSDQPRVTAGTKKRLAELNEQWQIHKQQADTLESRIAAMQQTLFEAKIGPLTQ